VSVSRRLATVLQEDQEELEEAKGFPFHLPAEADEAVGKTYRALVNFKLAMDRMEEIPKWLRPLYSQAIKAMDAVGDARKHTYQLREMAKRTLPR